MSDLKQEFREAIESQLPKPSGRTLTWVEAIEDGLEEGDTIQFLPPQVFKSEDGTQFRVRDEYGFYSPWMSVELIEEQLLPPKGGTK